MGRPDHYFNPTVAEKYGVDVAIFLHNIFHWVEYNKDHKKNFYEGRYWTYNSISAFCEVHPYWSKRQIERITSTCKKEGLLLTGCFNEDQRDRTMWYTLSDKAMSFFEDNPTTGMVHCISPNGEMQLPESCQTFHQTVEPLPINKPDNKQQNPPYNPPKGETPAKKRGKRSNAPKEAPDWKPERFADFWAAYPCGRSKQAAIKAWDKLKPDDALLVVMARALKRQMASEEWQRGIGIPYASTWLNNRRWEDEDKPRPTRTQTAQGESARVLEEEGTYLL